MPEISESKTRQEIIDKRLLAVGWNVKNPSQVTSELDIWVGLPDMVKEPEHKYQGFQFADYVLLGDDGHPLAVVEAKKLPKMPELDKNRLCSTPKIFKKILVKIYHLFFTLTGMIFIFGTLKNIHQERCMVFLVRKI